MMNIKAGDTIKYTFPDPSAVSEKSVTGIIEEIYESYIVMMTEENVKIKINYKNLENIDIVKRAEDLTVRD